MASLQVDAAQVEDVIGQTPTGEPQAVAQPPPPVSDKAVDAEEVVAVPPTEEKTESFDFEDDEEEKDVESSFLDREPDAFAEFNEDEEEEEED